MLVISSKASKGVINQIKSNQIKSNQIKSNQIISNQIKSNQIKSNQIKSNQIKSNQIKSDQETIKCRAAPWLSWGAALVSPSVHKPLFVLDIRKF